MNVKLEVRISESSGMPYACVPSYAMWELVEYLAINRTPVLYGHSADGFTVTFQRLDRQTAQALLDAWTCPRSPQSVGPQTSHKYDDEACYLPG